LEKGIDSNDAESVDNACHSIENRLKERFGRTKTAIPNNKRKRVQEVSPKGEEVASLTDVVDAPEARKSDKSSHVIAPKSSAAKRSSNLTDEVSEVVHSSEEKGSDPKLVASSPRGQNDNASIEEANETLMVGRAEKVELSYTSLFTNTIADSLSRRD
jgi:hypothetical protein